MSDPKRIKVTDATDGGSVSLYSKRERIQVKSVSGRRSEEHTSELQSPD